MSQAAASAAGSAAAAIDRSGRASTVRRRRGHCALLREDAVVVDEGREWRGMAAIRRWRATVATAYQYTRRPGHGSGGAGRGGTAPNVTTCTSISKATSPGQVHLHRIASRLRGRIARLEIVPAEAAR